MRTDRLTQYAYATTKAAAKQAVPNRPSASGGMGYLRVIPLAGFAAYPILVSLDGARSGAAETEFLAGEWQRVQCSSARVLCRSLSEQFGLGASSTVANLTGGPTDPDANVAPIVAPVPPGQSVPTITINGVPYAPFFSGLYAFQWSNDPAEVSGSSSLILPRQGMQPIFRALIGQSLILAPGSHIWVQDFGQPGALNATIHGAMLGCGYASARHTIDGLGAAPITFHKWFLDPWCYDQAFGVLNPALVFAGDFTVQRGTGPGTLPNSVVIDESIDSPGRPGWMMITADAADAGKYAWTLEIS